MKLYPKAKQAFLSGAIDLTSDDIRVLLVSSSYTQNDAHDFLNDVASGRLGESAALASKTVTDGTFDFADPTVSITADGTIVAAILYQHTGTESTSHLIAYDDKDSDGTTALSRAVLTGDTVTVQVDASGLFDL